MFSHRQGLKPIKAIQIDSMDDDLRNSLWNVLFDNFFRTIGQGKTFWGPNFETLIVRLWIRFFKLPIDMITGNGSVVLTQTRKYFFSCHWHEVYDLIEFTAKSFPYPPSSQKFIDACNTVLKRESSAYRFVRGKIVPLTSEAEISEIEKALRASGPLKPVSEHLNRALELLADKTSPDYRNSIKESISAVEALCGLVTGNPKATLGDALKVIRMNTKVEMHPALNRAFDNLYGYTSDAQGIRHALTEEPNLDQEDANYMLVACSAFINYLTVKASKAGIKL